MEIVVIWFRRDMRLDDHTALSKAITYAKKHQYPLFAFYHLDPFFTEMELDLNNEHFFQNLAHFVKEARESQVYVHLFHDDVLSAFQQVMDVYDIKAVFFNEDQVGNGHRRDNQVTNFLEEKGIHVSKWQDTHLHGARDIMKADGFHYQVFTPYYQSWRKQEKQPVIKVDKTFFSSGHMICNESLSQKGDDKLRGIIKRCARKFDQIGSDKAMNTLHTFIQKRLTHYHKKRDIPSVFGTSKLSRFLKTGTISIRTVFHAINEEALYEDEGRETFIKELAWRDFYHMIFAHYPKMKQKEINPSFEGIKWNEDEALFEAWCKGETGFPLVDAGMRQLNEEGWMHNRLRMVTASFLTKDYLIDWRKGEAYFAKKLVDYDEASNIGGFQWAASVGTDAVPYFRIFNPTTQSKRFDSSGEYIRRYVPELKHVDEKWIHEPSKMPIDEQMKSGCVIGDTYPLPTVDHQERRKKAISLFEEAKGQ
ncbi:cryptochrome/photolyase family protein [Bacillus xiamenensis]|uniref:cryptochrome/photolyase family protein n=1 Tax=Bacillus xiamenensis TaxID=1178537 RepID=UPI00028D525D|nr:deoxyribodipyrimidine photo-lyase [Bacillus xiamenensis]EKF37567.1 deoxyribodipyrimidine photo-lyase [Bacillus xiamenensis]